MIYDFTVKDNLDNDVSLSEYKGKVLLIINTATKCGFTKQYDDIEKLYEMYKDKGFEVLDFPCNQFFKQAPGTDEEIDNFCKLKFGTTFKRFKKIDVKGENADPLYKYLFDVTGKKPKWNFTKYLVDKEGNIVEVFASAVKPFEIEDKIKELLEK